MDILELLKEQINAQLEVIPEADCMKPNWLGIADWLARTEYVVPLDFKIERTSCKTMPERIKVFFKDNTLLGMIQSNYYEIRID